MIWDLICLAWMMISFPLVFVMLIDWVTDARRRR